MELKQSCEKQIAARFVYLWFHEEFCPNEYKGENLERELKYLQKAYGQNNEITKLANKMWDSNIHEVEKIVNTTGSGNYQIMDFVPGKIYDREYLIRTKE